ncbi:hypothetical protein GCM10008941_32500 [Rhizomicrobium palustre]|jgi:Flp pilus assembly protein TadD
MAYAEDKPANTKLSQAQLNDSVEGGLRQAQAARARGDLSEAVKVLSQLMLVNPDDGRIISEYGKVLVQQGRTSEALDFLKRAVQIVPNDWTLYSALGVAFDGAGDYANAKLSYEHALNLRPGEAAVLNNFALSRALAGDLIAAKAMIGQASASSKDPRVTRNEALIGGLTAAAAAPAAAAPQTAPQAKASVAAKSVAAAPTTAPRPLTGAEGAKVVMQEVPVDPKAGPVKKAAAVKTADKSLDKSAPVAAKPAKPKQGDGVPALRLSGDRL